jgi:superoxide dismutase
MAWHPAACITGAITRLTSRRRCSSRAVLRSKRRRSRRSCERAHANPIGRCSTRPRKLGTTISTGAASEAAAAASRAADAQRLLADSFPSYQAFCQEFIRKASDRFASGWAWLVLDRSQLRIVTTGNADTPLTSARRPLLACDLWEHAYYPDYQNRRVDYVAAFLASLVDWNFVNQNLATGPDLPAFAGAGI